MNQEEYLEKEYQKALEADRKDQESFEKFEKQQEIEFNINVEKELDKFCAKAKKIHDKYDQKLKAIQKKYN